MGSRAPQAIIAVTLIVAAGLVVGFVAGQGAFSSPTAPTEPPAAQVSASPRASRTPAPTDPADPRAQATPPATTPEPSQPAPSATPPALVEADVPVVPVVSFWSGATSITRDEITRALAGDSNTYKRVVMLTGTGDTIEGSFGIARTLGHAQEADANGLVDAVAEGALGLIPVSEVTPRVKALAVDGVSLFGNNRAKSLEGWPLMVRLILPAGEWDQAATWTLVAGGDIMPDRGTYEQVTLEGKGVDYPWDGGTVSITGHHCCTPFGWPVTESKRTGNKGAVRGLFNDADIAMANLEGPVKDNFSYHTHGFTFTGDPRLVQGFVGAGFDFLSLANNHIGNGGASGLRDTIRHLNDAGIAHAGAGANIDAAAKPAYLAANGTRVAVVSCSEVGGFRAGPDKTGMLRCSAPQTLEAINEARAKADVVIVFPHWGAEYRAKPTASQRNLAANWAAAGVDVVLGSHPHWAEAIDEIDGTLVVYCMGNLVFDQTWSENTLEGLIVELTFQGDRLVQAWLHPTLILSAVQPNLLNHDAGGSDVLTRVRQASQGLFDY